MSVKQISIFVENQPGHLAEVTSLLAENNVNLRALSIADTSDFGILRIIVEDPDGAADFLKDNGYPYAITDVLAVVIPDTPGALAHILNVLAEHEISIEYTYAFLSENVGKASLIFRVEDNELAEKALAEAGLTVASQDELF